MTVAITGTKRPMAPTDVVLSGEILHKFEPPGERPTAGRLDEWEEKLALGIEHAGADMSTMGGPRERPAASGPFTEQFIENIRAAIEGPELLPANPFTGYRDDNLDTLLRLEDERNVVVYGEFFKHQVGVVVLDGMRSALPGDWTVQIPLWTSGARYMANDLFPGP